ncbi:MAG: DUF1559 domain-containing protein, partial [Pirellulales bacterium]|nr:DUF1559 domain-containing protein [Pirellulales bacterium]
ATFIELLVCPSDQGPTNAPRMNYVVNGGQPGSDSPADGIFFDHAKAERVYITKDDFRDGLANTIMLAENLDSTSWDVTDEANQCILWPLTDSNEINNGTGARPSSHHPGGFVAAFADGSVKFLSETPLNEDAAVHTEGSVYVAYLTPGGDDDFPTIVDGVDPCDQPDAGVEINDGLDWLAAHQSSDGSWSLRHSTHPDCNGQCGNDSSLPDTRIAATGLALLPLLGSGSAPGSGPYAENICMGLEYLMARQGADGSLAEDYQSGRILYPHLIALEAMSEGVALASDVRTVGGCGNDEHISPGCTLDVEALREATQKAIDWAVASAAPVDYGWPEPTHMKGGWDYFFGGNPSHSDGTIGDLSHHLWGVSALLTAKRQGLTVPDEAIEMLSAFLDSTEVDPRVTDQGVTLGDYRYTAGWSSAPYNTATVSMTASGLFCRTLLGVPASHAKIDQFANTIAPSDGAMYYNLHATQLMHRVGGSRWDTWNSQMQQMLLAAQEQNGHLRGSFYWSGSPMDSRVAEWNAQGGRLYCTVFALLCLEQNFSRLKLSKVGAQ